jgi:undecaprenyl-diphosphatase
MLFGLSPRRAAEFSFLLGLPTLSAACAYEIFKQRHDLGVRIDELGGPAPIVIGLAVAAISAAFAVKWLVGYVSRGGFAVFGWWRVAVATALGAVILSGNMTL